MVVGADSAGNRRSVGLLQLVPMPPETQAKASKRSRSHCSEKQRSLQLSAEQGNIIKKDRQPITVIATIKLHVRL